MPAYEILDLPVILDFYEEGTEIPTERLLL